MKALVKSKSKSGLELCDIQTPSIGDDEVLVKVRISSICGTDLHIYNWDSFSKSLRLNLPVIAGHEYTGEIVEIGKNTTSMTGDLINIGDSVSGESHIFCGSCEFCRNGKQHICSSTKLLGVDRDGCFAEYISVPSRTVWIHNRSQHVKINALYEPIGNAVFAVNSAEVADKNVLIIGTGPMGLASIAMCIYKNAKTIVVIDKSTYRLKLAEKMGATHCVSIANEDVAQMVEKIKDSIGGISIDVVLEMSGATNSMQVATKIAKNGGKVVAFGIPDGSQLISVNLAQDIIFKGLHIIGVAGRTIPITWHQTDEFITSSGKSLFNIITHTLPLIDYDKAFELMKSRKCGKVQFSINK